MGVDVLVVVTDSGVVMLMLVVSMVVGVLFSAEDNKLRN